MLFEIMLDTSNDNPRELGRKAFHDGMKAIPVLCWTRLGRSGYPDIEWSREWAKGWHMENANAPVPGFTDDTAKVA